MKCTVIFAIILSTLFANTQGFAPVNRAATTGMPVLNTNTNTLHHNTGAQQQQSMPVSLKNQRHSMAQVQTMSFFGLGGPEIAVVLIAVFFVVGPQKLAEIGRDAGRAASDFRDVPKEFQKGFEEGEIEARSRNAKQMDGVDDDPESS